MEDITMGQLIEIDDKRYVALKRGLKTIDNNKNDWDVLFDMELLEITKNDDYDINLLDSLCVKNGTTFRCVCGKNPLQHLAIIQYKDNRKFTLGSVCIKELETIMELENQDPRIRAKLATWIDAIKTYNRKRNYKPCCVCGYVGVSKDKLYADRRRNKRCKSCVNRHHARCIDCKKWVEHGKNKKFDLKLCRPCFMKTRSRAPSISLEFLVDSDSD